MGGVSGFSLMLHPGLSGRPGGATPVGSLVVPPESSLGDMKDPGEAFRRVMGCWREECRGALHVKLRAGGRI